MELGTHKTRQFVLGLTLKGRLEKGPDEDKGEQCW